MPFKTFLDFLPLNFRHEKAFLSQNNFSDYKKLSMLTDLDINNIQKKSALCTLNNLKKIRAIAMFKKKIKISPSEAYLLLHCGIGSVESLSRFTAYELESRIRRLERNLRTSIKTNVTISVLKDWIEKAKEISEKT